MNAESDTALHAAALSARNTNPQTKEPPSDPSTTLATEESTSSIEVGRVPGVSCPMNYDRKPPDVITSTSRSGKGSTNCRPLSTDDSLFNSLLSPLPPLPSLPSPASDASLDGEHYAQNSNSDDMPMDDESNSMSTTNDTTTPTYVRPTVPPPLPLVGALVRLAKLKRSDGSPTLPGGVEARIVFAWAAIEDGVAALKIPHPKTGTYLTASELSGEHVLPNEWCELPWLFDVDAATFAAPQTMLALLEELYKARNVIVHRWNRGSQKTWSATLADDLRCLHAFAVGFLTSLFALSCASSTLKKVCQLRLAMHNAAPRRGDKKQRKAVVKAAMMEALATLDEAATHTRSTATAGDDKVSTEALRTAFNNDHADFGDCITAHVEGALRACDCATESMALAPAAKAAFRRSWLGSLLGEPLVDHGVRVVDVTSIVTGTKTADRQFLEAGEAMTIARDATRSVQERVLFAAIYVEDILRLRSSESCAVATVEVAHVMLLVGLRHSIAHGVSTSDKIPKAVAFLRTHAAMPADDREVADAFECWERSKRNPFTEHPDTLTPSVVAWVIQSAFAVAEVQPIKATVVIPRETKLRYANVGSFGSVAEALRAPENVQFQDQLRHAIPAQHLAGPLDAFCPNKKHRVLGAACVAPVTASIFFTPSGEAVATFVRVEGDLAPLPPTPSDQTALGGMDHPKAAGASSRTARSHQYGERVCGDHPPSHLLQPPSTTPLHMHQTKNE